MKAVGDAAQVTNTKHENKQKVVRVDGEVFESLKAYSDLTGVNIATVASKAIRDWMETVGAVHMEVWRNTKFAVQPGQSGNVVAFPVAAQESGRPTGRIVASAVCAIPSPDPNAAALFNPTVNPGKPD